MYNSKLIRDSYQNIGIKILVSIEATSADDFIIEVDYGPRFAPRKISAICSGGTSQTR